MPMWKHPDQKVIYEAIQNTLDKEFGMDQGGVPDPLTFNLKTYPNMAKIQVESGLKGSNPFDHVIYDEVSDFDDEALSTWTGSEAKTLTINEGAVSPEVMEMFTGQKLSEKLAEPVPEAVLENMTGKKKKFTNALRKQVRAWAAAHKVKMHTAYGLLDMEEHGYGPNPFKKDGNVPKVAIPEWPNLAIQGIQACKWMLSAAPACVTCLAVAQKQGHTVPKSSQNIVENPSLAKGQDTTYVEMKKILKEANTKVAKMQHPVTEKLTQVKSSLKGTNLQINPVLGSGGHVPSTQVLIRFSNGAEVALTGSVVEMMESSYKDPYAPKIAVYLKVPFTPAYLQDLLSSKSIYDPYAKSQHHKYEGLAPGQLAAMLDSAEKYALAKSNQLKSAMAQIQSFGAKIENLKTELAQAKESGVQANDSMHTMAQMLDAGEQALVTLSKAGIVKYPGSASIVLMRNPKKASQEGSEGPSGAQQPQSGTSPHTNPF